MKKSLFGLLIAIVTFFGGTFTAQIFRTEQKPLPKPIFGKEIVDIPLFETAPINVPEDLETIESIDAQIIYAWYSLDSYKGMSEVAMIKFYGTDVDDDGVKLKKMTFYTGIFTHLFKDDVYEGFAEGIQTTVEGNKLKFKTKKLKGIEYRTLQKFVKGKKVAEVSGDFAYTEPYCLN
jgi:hypothetical protein